MYSIDHFEFIRQLMTISFVYVVNDSGSNNLTLIQLFVKSLA